MKNKLILLLILVFCSTAYTQVNYNPVKSNSTYLKSELRNEFLKSNKTLTDSLDNKVRVKGSSKSPGLAFLYSLFVPGMGQAYAKRFDVGKYYLLTEAALWLGYASFSIYGKWLQNDSYDFASVHAGINKDGKDDDFFINIGNYDNVEQYNDDMLRKGQYDKVYFPGQGKDFYWDQVESRKRYRDDKLAGDRIINDRLFIVGGILINHIVSAISAIVLTSDYNSSLKKGGGMVMKADVIRNFNHVDGLKLQITKWF
jgi:hypothetical protein